MDLISREDTIKTIHKYFIKLLDKIPTKTDEDGDTVYSDMKTLNSLLTINKWLTKEIKAIPTIEERKEGEWVYEECEYLDDETDEGQIFMTGKRWYCSRCGFSKGFMMYKPKENYCPNCGAKMKGE